MSIFFLTLIEGISLCEQTDLATALMKGEGKEKGSVEQQLFCNSEGNILSWMEKGEDYHVINS